MASWREGTAHLLETALVLQHEIRWRTCIIFMVESISRDEWLVADGLHDDNKQEQRRNHPKGERTRKLSAALTTLPDPWTRREFSLDIHGALHRASSAMEAKICNVHC